MQHRPTVVFLLLLAAACEETTVPCTQDADCGDGVCVSDLDRGDTYCSRTCDSDDDCPTVRFCDVRITGTADEADVLALCIERVRDCGEEEFCDGLDDDCNGDVDDDCQLLRCHDDPSCGGVWPCAPKRDAPDSDLQCQAPNPDGAAPGTPCTAASDCYNDLCEVGVCAPVCHFDEECPADQHCALPSASGTAVRHSTCHTACDVSTACADGTVCVLRADPYSCYWRAVCSPSRGTLDMGEPCQADDECESALCMGTPARCTRPCATGFDCNGLGAECGTVIRSPDPLACPTSSIQVCKW